MRLLKFTIRNYRSCLLTILYPNNDLTTLIGVNGSGKSNLLNALLLLRNAVKGQMRYYGDDKQYVNRSHINVEIEMEGKKIALKGSIYYLTNERNIDEVVGTKLKWNIQSITGQKSWIELPLELILHNRNYRFVISKSGRRLSYKEMARGNWYGYREMKNLLPEKVFSVFRNISQYLLNISYYSASQFSDPTRCPVSFRLEGDKTPLRRRTNKVNHQQYLYDLYNAFKVNKQVFERYENVVGKSGIGLVDGIEFNEINLPSNIVEVRAGGKTIKRERTQVVIVPIFNIDNKDLSPNQLSEGTFKTLALLFYVLTDTSDLLIIEEPEVCIHHGLLNSIISIIKTESKDKQIIISTHSDYVLDQMEPENVILVDRKADKGTKANHIKDSLSKSDYKALRTYLKDSGNLGEYWREGGLIDE